MLWNIWYYHLKWREMIYLTISWCYGSKMILWAESLKDVVGENSDERSAPWFCVFFETWRKMGASGGIWGKDKLEAARWFLSQATTLRSLQVLKIQFQTKIFPFWREGKMCFSVIPLPGPATFAFLTGKKYFISFLYNNFIRILCLKFPKTAPLTI